MIIQTIPQKTLAQTVSLSGIGLHTGKQVHLNFKPAPENTGFVFHRTDLSPVVEIPASAALVSQTERSTSLQKGEVVIQTTEHVLAALVGAGIDNCIIEIDNSELPIMDGSSIVFSEAIEKAGITAQTSLRQEFVVDEIISVKDEQTGSEIMVLPADKTTYTVMIDFETQVLGTQNAVLEDISSFHKEISAARTFCFLHELETMLENGLIKGGDLNNAIVYVDQPLADRKMDLLHKAFNTSELKVHPNGILDNLTLHHPNEAARHKLLDVVGDLALAGMPIQGRIVATKPGHSINTQFAQKLAQVIKEKQRNKAPKICDDTPVLMDINQIMAMLPHRPPFLLVDKIFELSQTHVVGLKNVTMNEPFFQGHFPGAPIMPGVLQIEAMAQAGGVLVLNTVPDPENYLTFFMKIDNAKFKRPVLPGDTLIFRLELITPIRRGICNMKGYAFVNGQLVSEAELMAQILRRENAPKPS